VDAPTPEIPPELFEGRKVLVYGEDGTALIAEAAVLSDGTFHLYISPGTYVIDFSFVGIERAEGLPATLTLVSGETTQLDISVDTVMNEAAP